MKLRTWLIAALAAFFTGGVFAFGGGRIDSMDSLARITPGVTTVQQVREMFGPPARTQRFPKRGIEAIEYEARDYSDLYIISISYGSDGIVREVLKLRQATP